MANFSDNIVNKRFRIVFDYLKENHLIRSKSDIASKLGTYNHIINNILHGKRNITLDQLNKLIEHYHVNANFLFGCSNQMLEDGSDINFSIAGQEYEKNITFVDDLAMAGNAIDAENKLEEELPKFFIPNIPSLDRDGLIAIEISGDSMLPNITNGDLVICEQIDGSSINDNSIHIVVTDTVVAKRVQKIKENNQTVGLRLISDNTIYPLYEVHMQEVRQIYKVIYRLTKYGIS